MTFFLKDKAWLADPVVEFIFILLPPFFCLGLIFFFPDLFQNTSKISDAWWVILILLVDVAHVYSTLYRTYFHKEALSKHKNLLIVIPILAFVIGVFVYTSSTLMFWRLLAYLAVFHFIRQQYGFMRLYARKDNNPKWMNRLDVYVIYLATVYPLLYWHLSDSRNFNWFVAGDFLLFRVSYLNELAHIIYLFSLALFFLKELYLIFILKQFNFPKTVLIIGTIISWYFGIVYFNGDMVFTLLNVVSHGIPYMALVWLFSVKNERQIFQKSFVQKLITQSWGIVFFLVVIFVLAYVEEGFWDTLLWHEHKKLYTLFYKFSITVSDKYLCVIVPLLALPQITHYVIDGFIWKVRLLKK